MYNQFCHKSGFEEFKEFKFVYVPSLVAFTRLDKRLILKNRGNYISKFDYMQNCPPNLGQEKIQRSRYIQSLDLNFMKLFIVSALLM